MQPFLDELKFQYTAMDADHAFRLICEILAPESLTQVYEVTFRGTWEGQSYQAIAESADYDTSYVKDIGSRLWQMLSTKLNRRVTKQNIRQVFNQLDQGVISYKNLETVPRWDANIDTHYFYGRISEQEVLKQWLIVEQCRLVAVVGLKGAGKTLLVAKVLQQLQDKFDCVVWISLLKAPPFPELLRNIISSVQSNNDSELQFGDDLILGLNILLRILQKQRICIVLDEFETVIRPPSNDKQNSYDFYRHLLRWVGEHEHQSSLILTSCEKTSEIVALEGENLPVRSLKLMGLSDEAAQLLLADKGLTGINGEVLKLIHYYDAHPLILKYAGTLIKNLFHGDTTSFLRQDVMAMSNIRCLLDWHFERLSKLGKLLMYLLALSDEPILIEELFGRLAPLISGPEILEAIEILSCRSLVEQREQGFLLSALFKRYVCERLVKLLTSEIISGEFDVLNRLPLSLSSEGSLDYQAMIVSSTVSSIMVRIVKRCGNCRALQTHLQALLDRDYNLDETFGYWQKNIETLLCMVQSETESV